MKIFSKLIFLLLFVPFMTHAQHGFISQYLGGDFESVNLNNASRTLLGTTVSNLAASDLGANGVMYGISNDNFYSIDTTDGTATLIAAITPPANHVWTGMAYDDTDGIMYGYSSWGIAAGEGSLHIIDVTNATYSLVGTQTVNTAIAAIAIDVNDGQMYGIGSGGNGKLLAIDKTDGSALQIGSGLGTGVAGMGQGLDYDNVNGIMYFTNYNSLTFINTLRTVNLTAGTSTEVGDIGGWVGTIAIPGSVALAVDFTSDITTVCAGSTVSFTDLSTGATTWSWTFEGGTPATSTDQNPVVTYNTVGSYDVTLEVGDGTTTESMTVTDMISVIDIPAQPATPSGPTAACANEEYTYTTLSVGLADSYIWEVLPADAGTIVGSDTTATFTSDPVWTGDYTIKVQATNSCGTSTWSAELTATLFYTPQAFTVQPGGGYCDGGAGLEVILDGSETGVDYELFLDDVSTGTIEPGTGNSINFGLQTTVGTYTVVGLGVSCETDMYGGCYIFILPVPGAASQPTGPEEVCAGNITDYQTAAVTDADTLLWTLTPVEAGVITGSGENISVEWSATYKGMAYLSVYGSNDCGDGATSDDLEINVNLVQPEVNGETLVCEDEENTYTTANNTGSTYVWEVVGGNIVSGAGTYEINVLWTTVGDGSVMVTETTAVGCEGSSEALQITIDDCTGIGEDKAHSLKVYPNPARNVLNIQLPVGIETTGQIAVYNQYGQLVHHEVDIHAMNGSVHQLNTSDMNSGLYIIRLTTSDKKEYRTRFEILK